MTGKNIFGLPGGNPDDLEAKRMELIDQGMSPELADEQLRRGQETPGSPATIKPRNENVSGQHTPPSPEKLAADEKFRQDREHTSTVLRRFQEAMDMPDQRAKQQEEPKKDTIDVYRDKNGSLLFGSPDQMAGMAQEQGLTRIGSRSEWEAQNRSNAEAREKARGDHYTSKYKTEDDFVNGEKAKLISERKQLQGQMSGSRKSIQDLIDEEVGRMGGTIQPYGGNYDMSRGGERVTRYGRGHGGKGARVVAGDNDLYEQNKARMLNEGMREKAYDRLRNRGAISEWFNQDAAFAKNQKRLDYINSRLDNWADSEKMLRNNWASWTKKPNDQTAQSTPGQAQSDPSMGANIPDYLKANKANKSPAPDPTVDTLKSISSPLTSKFIPSDGELFGQAVKDVNEINGLADFRKQSTPLASTAVPSDWDIFFGAAKDVQNWAASPTQPAQAQPGASQKPATGNQNPATGKQKPSAGKDDDESDVTKWIYNNKYPAGLPRFGTGALGMF